MTTDLGTLLQSAVGSTYTRDVPRIIGDTTYRPLQDIPRFQARLRRMGALP